MQAGWLASWKSDWSAVKPYGYDQVSLNLSDWAYPLDQSGQNCGRSVQNVDRSTGSCYADLNNKENCKKQPKFHKIGPRASKIDFS